MLTLDREPYQAQWTKKVGKAGTWGHVFLRRDSCEQSNLCAANMRGAGLKCHTAVGRDTKSCSRGNYK